MIANGIQNPNLILTDSGTLAVAEAAATVAATAASDLTTLAGRVTALESASHFNSHGGCFEFNEGGSALSLSSNASWYRWITGGTGTVKGAPYLTWDNAAAPTGKRLVVGASGAGVYLVTCAFSVVSNFATDIDAAVYVNSSRQDNLRVDQSFPASALYQTGTISGLVTLAASDTVTLWFNSSQNTATLTVKHVNLVVVRIA